MAGQKGPLRVKMGVDGIVHMDHIHAVSPVADDAEAATARAGEHARDQAGIADAPNQVGTKGDRGEAVGVGGEHGALGPRLGQGIGARAARREGQRLIGPREVPAVENDAGCAGVDEAAHAGDLGRGQQRERRVDIVALEIGGLAPNADSRSDVEHGVDVPAGFGADRRIVEGPHDDAETLLRQLWLRAARDNRNLAPGGAQAGHEAGSEEAGSSGDENRRRGLGGGRHGQDAGGRVIGVAVAAQRASVSRWIFALWRTSTGRWGCT